MFQDETGVPWIPRQGDRGMNKPAGLSGPDSRSATPITPATPAAAQAGESLDRGTDVLTASSADVAHCFNLFLGCHLQGPGASAGWIGSYLGAMLRDILGTEEFLNRVLTALLLRQSLPHSKFYETQLGLNIDFAQRRLPVSSTVCNEPDVSAAASTAALPSPCRQNSMRSAPRGRPFARATRRLGRKSGQAP